MKIQVSYSEDEVAKTYGFKLTSKYARILENGMVEVTLTWTTNKDETNFKYPSTNWYGYSSRSVQYNLEFEEVKYKQEELGVSWETNFNLTVSVGISKDFEYEALFHQNIKYGCLVYFAPKGWNSVNENIPELKVKKVEHFS